MARHRVFNADRFLDKFQGFEQLLRDFVGVWEDRLEIDSSGLDVAELKRWLVEGTGEAKDELLEALYQVYDLCTERGHEDLLAAIGEDPSYTPDPGHRLPVECLALKLRTEREDLFFLAYDRYNLWRVPGETHPGNAGIPGLEEPLEGGAAHLPASPAGLHQLQRRDGPGGDRGRVRK